MSLNTICQLCSSEEVSVFFEIMDMPVHIGILWPNRDAALNCPKGDIKLAFCKNCGFITNLAFEPFRLQYTQEYDNTLHFSPFFQKYAHSVASRLIERYDLHNKTVIEIGCGKGDFLLLLCELGNNRGVGFDPSYEARNIDHQIAARITFIRGFYSRHHTSYQADLICCRYVLEHIENPAEFLTMIRNNIGDRSSTVVHFEVPNVLFILRNLSIWDIIYEHCSYFSPCSFARVFTSCGFDVYDLTETYEGQNLSIEALPSKNPPNSRHDYKSGLKELIHYLTAFGNNYRTKLETWHHNLKRIEHAGKQAVVWGAGAKGVSFLNMLKIQDQIEYVVDINPNKKGNYIAGTGQKVVSPEFLQDYEPDVVIVMNPIYKSEIEQLIRRLGLITEFLYS